MQECKVYTTKYRLYINDEQIEQERLQAYLEHTGKSANAFIKEAVREKLDTIGWMTDTDMDTDQEHTEDRSS